jgi:hypothetical protein
MCRLAKNAANPGRSRRSVPGDSSRRGSVLVLSAVLMVILLGVVAFAVDLGYIMLVRTQLQTAADSAALAAAGTLSGTDSEIIAAAQQFAGYQKVGGVPVTVASDDLVFGTWDANAMTFTPSATVGNAVRVITRVNDGTGNNRLFFGRVLGVDRFATEASAIATGNPRDIAFVVDLSGSMNNDTEPCWATHEITNKFGPEGYPTVGTDMMQNVFNDFGYGTFPGTLEWVGAPLGVAADSNAYANLTKDGGPLTLATIPATYKILSGDSEATRKTKAYKWMIDNQLAVIMPAAQPAPNSATNYNYWLKYLDYVIQSKSVTGRGTLPPSQDSDRITGLDNPSSASYPDATTTEVNSYRNKLGYRTYVQFMMDFGRNVQPDGVNYTPLSVNSPYCPYHLEDTAGGRLSFPPSEQPTHSIRRSLIAGIQEVKNHNHTISDVNQRDWVSVITFDTVSGTVVRQSLTGDYDAAMLSCTGLQAVSDSVGSTATESGLIAARQHIEIPANGGVGRRNAEKVVVLLTDGIPNLKSSSDSTVSSYRTSHPSSDYYGGSSAYPYDAAIMQTSIMQLKRWKTYAVGVGLGADYDFMDRMARMSTTANPSGQGPRTSGSPVAYEEEVSAIFRDIISNPQLRLVR